MKIAIDNIIFQLQQGHFRGVSRVWANLLPYMKDMLEGKHELVLLCRQGSCRENFGFKTYSIPRYGNHLLDGDKDAKVLTSVCRKLGVDVFITTYHTRVLGIKNIVMVYDMIPEIRSWLSGCNEYVARSKAYLNADTLICISENTKRDLCSWYDTTSKRVEVAFLGVSSKEFHPLISCENARFMEKYGLKPGYMVLDGDITGEVSEVFCKAFSSLGTNLSLFWYGGALKDYVMQSCTKYKIPFQKVGRLAEKEIPLALSGAGGLIFISDAEGFGLPVLEAMSCRTPVVCSHTASLPEVGGDSVQYFANHSFECIRDNLSSFFDIENRKQIAEKGFIRSKEFSWKKTAEKVVKVLLT